MMLYLSCNEILRHIGGLTVDNVLWNNGKCSRYLNLLMINESVWNITVYFQSAPPDVITISQ
jgi:hypothetical protein